jgi:tRNA 2-(methylsulfanyl)-N6-isopentenyladenosine37 hydroxylase
MLCLKVPTDGSWAAMAMRDADAVLVDHAHCELKAASNALSLIALVARHPADGDLAQALSDLAREEIEHFQRVMALLTSRRVPLGLPPVDAYAAALRRTTGGLARGPGVTALVDRLLVAALIEARSCERFQLLADTARADPTATALHDLWRELLGSEARHYRTYVDLAVRAAGGDRVPVAGRLEQLAEVEGAIVTALARGGDDSSRATIHG